MARESKSKVSPPPGRLQRFLIKIIPTQTGQAAPEEETLPGVPLGQDGPATGQPSTNGGQHWVCTDWNQGLWGTEDRQQVSGRDAQDYVVGRRGADHGRDPGCYWVSEGKVSYLEQNKHYKMLLFPQEIDELLGQNLTDEDEDAVAAELDSILLVSFMVQIFIISTINNVIVTSS